VGTVGIGELWMMEMLLMDQMNGSSSSISRGMDEAGPRCHFFSFLGMAAQIGEIDL
jgi:hypothetical protein